MVCFAYNYIGSHFHGSKVGAHITHRLAVYYSVFIFALLGRSIRSFPWLLCVSGGSFMRLYGNFAGENLSANFVAEILASDFCRWIFVGRILPAKIVGGILAGKGFRPCNFLHRKIF